MSHDTPRVAVSVCEHGERLSQFQERVVFVSTAGRGGGKVIWEGGDGAGWRMGDGRLGWEQ